MRKRLANLASNFLNPFLVSVMVILWLSLSSSASSAEAFKWTLILISLCVLPVYLMSVYSVRSGRLDAIFSNTRKQRTRIYLFGCVCAAISIIVMLLLGAPIELVAVLVAVLTAGILFMLVNLRWKISIHAAFVMGTAVLLIMLYGWKAVAAVAIVPVIAWSRMELGQHSMGQVTAGALLSTTVLVSVFYLFGLI